MTEYCKDCGVEAPRHLQSCPQWRSILATAAAEAAVALPNLGTMSVAIFGGAKHPAIIRHIEGPLVYLEFENLSGLRPFLRSDPRLSPLWLNTPPAEDKPQARARTAPAGVSFKELFWRELNVHLEERGERGATNAEFDDAYDVAFTAALNDVVRGRK